MERCVVSPRLHKQKVGAVQEAGIAWSAFKLRWYVHRVFSCSLGDLTQQSSVLIFVLVCFCSLPLFGCLIYTNSYTDKSTMG